MDKITVDQFRQLIHDGELQDPLIFLESIMGGQDPRTFSKIYELIMEINDFSKDGAPDEADWEELLHYAQTHCKFKSVTLTESTSAAKTLAEYLHPRRKQVDITGTTTSGTLEHTPLTEEEIVLFRERFNDEF